MESFNAIVRRGRITIPVNIRLKLGLEDGDCVQIEDLKKLVPTSEEA